MECWNVREWLLLLLLMLLWCRVLIGKYCIDFHCHLPYSWHARNNCNGHYRSANDVSASVADVSWYFHGGWFVGELHSFFMFMNRLPLWLSNGDFRTAIMGPLTRPLTICRQTTKIDCIEEIRWQMRGRNAPNWERTNAWMERGRSRHKIYHVHLHLYVKNSQESWSNTICDIMRRNSI